MIGKGNRQYSVKRAFSNAWKLKRRLFIKGEGWHEQPERLFSTRSDAVQSGREWVADAPRDNPRRKAKKKLSASKRISAALSRFLKKQNPGKMRGVTHVRVKKLKDGGLTITPVHGVTVRRRKR